MAAILFVKTSSLGDVVHNFPAVSDVARRLPGARIDWVVEEAFAGLAAMHGAVRRVMPVAIRRWRAAAARPANWSAIFAEVGALRRQLAAEPYDAVIDTQSLLKSALVARCANGTRHGMDSASAREPLAAAFYDVRHAVPRGPHAVVRNRQLTAAALGYTADGAPDYGLNASRNTEPGSSVVLLTMSSREDKLWPEAQWVELARALAAPVVLPWGSEAERVRAERIAAQLAQASVPPRMGIDGLARLFGGARAVVGVDTGLTHLAAALGTPTVGIYCGSDPALTGLFGMPRAHNVGALGRPPTPAEVLGSLT